jgi:hypothetical protein
MLLEKATYFNAIYVLMSLYILWRGGGDTTPKHSVRLRQNVQLSECALQRSGPYTAGYNELSKEGGGSLGGGAA